MTTATATRTPRTRTTKQPCRPCTPEEQALAAGYVPLATRLAADCWQGHRWVPWEDLLSEASLVLVQCAQCWEPSRGAFSTLLYTAVRRRLWDYCRRARRSRALWSGPRFGAGRWPNPDDLLEAQAQGFVRDHSPHPGRADDEEDLARLRAARRRLRPREHKVLALRYDEGRTLGGVGAALGVSRDRAKQLITRAQERLRKALGVKVGD